MNLTDPIFNKHDSHLEPKTYKRGSSRIDYAFCIPHIEKFIIRCGITPFDLFTSSDHRGLYLNINIFSYLKGSSTTPPTPESRLLVSTNPKATNQYKKDLMQLFLQHNVLKNITIIQTKIENSSLNESDMIHVNKVDTIITKYMLKAEKKLKYYSHSRPWSPTLAFAILEVILWKLITSSLYISHHNSSRIEAVQARMKLIPVSSLPQPIEQKNKSIINNNLKIVKKT